MEHIAVLTIATLLIALLSLLVWRKTKSVAFMIGFGFLYFWTLYGAWFTITDNLQEEKGERYQYLFFKLFPIYLDDDYLWTLVIYSLFVLVIQLTVLYFAKLPEQEILPERPLRLAHLKVVWISGLSALLSFLIIRPSLAAAAELSASGYGYVREGASSIPLFTLHQILNRVALIPLMIGLAVFFGGPDNKYIVGKRSVIALIGYLGVLTGMVVLCVVLGNRNELVFAFTAGGLFYLANTLKPKKLVLTGIGGAGLVALIVVKLFRDGIFSGSGGLKSIGVQAFLETIKSNEAFAAHFSLYGAIHKAVPFTYGSSFSALLLSVVPRNLWPDRPDDIYSYYAEHVQAIDDQGYSIHHATGWYLNFGVPGVLFGAFLLAWIWVRLFNAFNKPNKNGPFAHRVFTTVCFWTLTAALPMVIRAGPEAYKNVIIQAFLIPVIVVMIASLKLVVNAQGPAVIVDHKPVKGRSRLRSKKVSPLPSKI
jgi:hypothetical protein